MENEEFLDLKTIGLILHHKSEIDANPFSALPKKSVEEALKILEEYSAELTDITDMKK